MYHFELFMNTIQAFNHQETLLKHLLYHDFFDGKTKLCGGTSLARSYLEHRVSYDLDFFLKDTFDPKDITKKIQDMGLKPIPLEWTIDHLKANQWHGHITVPKTNNTVKVSFVEDEYFDVYPLIPTKINDMDIPGEDILGLYHRKLLTVSHTTENGLSERGRQKARDLYDLWCLSRKIMPIVDLVEQLPYSYNINSFVDGLDCMEWMNIIDEMDQIIPLGEYEKWSRDIGDIRRDLYLSAGVDLSEGFYDGDNDDDNTDRKPLAIKKTKP